MIIMATLGPIQQIFVVAVRRTLAARWSGLRSAGREARATVAGCILGQAQVAEDIAEERLQRRHGESDQSCGDFGILNTQHGIVGPATIGGPLALNDEPDANRRNDDDAVGADVSSWVRNWGQNTHRIPGNMTADSWIFFLKEVCNIWIKIPGMINIITSQARETPELTE